MKVISASADLDLSWVQSVFDRRYPGQNITVRAFDVTSSPSMTGNTALLKLSFEDQLPARVPRSLFLKFCRPNDLFIKDSEYLYYTRDYEGLEDSPVPVCYDAQYSPDGAYHVLLEDLSQTHYSNKEIRPTLEHALSVATELARLHAFRWATTARAAGLEGETTLQLSAFVEHVSPALPAILNNIGDEVPAQRLEIIRKVFALYPVLMKERAAVLSGQTLIHGDANPSNVLSPHDPAGKTYLIDRQPFTWSVRHWLGVLDLAYMAVPFWDVGDRRSLERPMLKHYHDSLTTFGVTDYSWEQCESDYQLCIPYGMYVAVGWGLNKQQLSAMKWLWEKQLRRSMEAFLDWGCDELLRPGRVPDA